MALKKLIEYTRDFKINSSLSKEETAEIEDGVSRFITELTTEVGKVDPMFEMRRIIKAGSFYEGTKNGRPDEFDFMVELSKKFTVERGCPNNPCTAHVKVPPETEMSAKTKHKVLSGYLLSAASFTHYWKAVEQVLEGALWGQNNLNNFRCKNGHLTIFTSLQGSGPNTEVHLVWHRDTGQSEDEPFSYGISIDVSPCIPCPDHILMAWKDHLRYTDFHSSGDKQELRPVLVIPSPKQRHSCGLSRYKTAEQQTDHGCWKISYAPAEVHMMKQLSETHNLCYRILKCMCKARGGYCSSTGEPPALKTLSSFMLKNSILHHTETCNDSEYDISWCLRSVLKYMSSCAEQKFLPAYFFPKKNLWTSKSAEDPRPPARILRRLSDFLFKELEQKCESNVTGNKLFSDILMMQEEFLHFEFEDYRMDK